MECVISHSVGWITGASRSCLGPPIAAAGWQICKSKRRASHSDGGCQSTQILEAWLLRAAAMGELPSMPLTPWHTSQPGLSCRGVAPSMDQGGYSQARRTGVKPCSPLAILPPHLPRVEHVCKHILEPVLLLIAAECGRSWPPRFLLSPYLQACNRRLIIAVGGQHRPSIVGRVGRL